MTNLAKLNPTHDAVLEYPYSFYDLQQSAYPNLIPTQDNFDGALYLTYDVAIVTGDAVPAFDPIYQYPEPLAPAGSGMAWNIGWVVIDIPLVDAKARVTAYVENIARSQFYNDRPATFPAGVRDVPYKNAHEVSVTASLVAQALTLVASGTPAVTVDVLTRDTDIQLPTATELLAIALAITAPTLAIEVNQSSLLAQIDAAGDYATLVAIDIEAGWPFPV